MSSVVPEKMERLLVLDAVDAVGPPDHREDDVAETARRVDPVHPRHGHVELSARLRPKWLSQLLQYNITLLAQIINPMSR